MTVGIENPERLKIRLFYEKEGATAKRYDSTAFWERRYHQKKASIVSAVLNHTVRVNDLVLDAGCGSGELSLTAERLGGRVVSLDISKSYLRRVSGLVESLVCASSDFLPFQSRAFDIVLSADVVEHVPAYDEALRELNRVSEKIVILTTPCDGFIRKLYGKAFPRRLIQLDRKVGHLYILPLREFKQKLLRFDSEIICRSFHVTQPLAGNYFPKKLENFIDFCEKIGNLCFPNQGTISLAILTRKQHSS